jgi:uncharacterized protein (DUF169 family)
MKVGNKVKVNNRTTEYIGEVVEIRWVADKTSIPYRWKKVEALIQCEGCRVRAKVEDLEVL